MRQPKSKTGCFVPADPVKKIRRSARWLLWWWLAGISLAPCNATPIKLRAVEATVPAQENHPLEASVDGVFGVQNGWQIKEGQFKQQFAVFATGEPVSAAMFQLQFFFLNPKTSSSFANFGVSVTTDEKPSLDGRWTPLLPEEAVANDTNEIAITGRTLRPTAQHPRMVITMRARAPFTGITGFRLRLRPNPLSTNQSGPPAIGSDPQGNFLLTEFTVEAEPLRTSNIALGRQVYSSGSVPSNLPKRNLTDGLISTYSQPDASQSGRSFYFTLDLGRTVALDHIVLRSRADGTDADRLAKYEVEVLKDSRRVTEWHAHMHSDGSIVSAGAADIIHGRDGEGIFAGDGVRIRNSPGQQLEIAEIEVYPELRPQAREWLADDFLLNPDKKLLIPAGVHKLRFTIQSREPGVSPLALAYRWRIPRWSGEWHDTGPEGRVEIIPPPPAGIYELQVQARHTDGVWDGSGEPITFEVALPWWRDPALAGLVFGGSTLLLGGTWWRIGAWRVRRRLVVAEQHLELHRERLRIARDMHDEIGARLTYIALLADRACREIPAADPKTSVPLEQLAENARSAVSALDDIVWAVNPQNETLGSLADYLSDYAPAYLQAATIECRLDFQLKQPQRTLTLAARQALLMAVKEALQNVVKHSRARKVCLSLNEQDERVEIVIADDGCGFVRGEAGIAHSGLEQMHQRMAELGGICEIGPGDGKHGTQVRLVLPFKLVHSKTVIQKA